MIIKYPAVNIKAKGRPNKLSTADKLLMFFIYYREYRTFLHISVCYGVSEMQCWHFITGTEQILLKSKMLHLQGKKALNGAENNFEIIVIDVSEHPIERPKKTTEELFRKEKATYYIL
jgi:Helix-turn-helix of DDE superfamily endonuclease